MQAFNHVAFGALIASVLPETAALPVAFISHFVLDSVPHYGNDDQAPRGSRPYTIRIAIDALLSIALISFFIRLMPIKATVILYCALLAVAPDLIWPLALTVKRTGLLWRFFVFHKTIQRESRRGIYLEVAWLALTTSLFVEVAVRAL